MRTAIIGLGYVGLPLLLLAEREGEDVVGYDIDSEKVEALREGRSPIDDEYLHERMEQVGELDVSTEEDTIADADLYIITVPTPVRGKTPDYEYVETAARTVAEHLIEGDTVVLESTVAPGTCRKIVAPILEDGSGLSVGDDVHLAFCPERVDPGNEEWTVENIPRVLGAMSDEGQENALAFYENILEGDVFEASSIEVAEASKVTENSFRDINIAFANEMAKIYDTLGISAKEVIEAASTKPFGFMAHWPGCGVGGHCIPVDPYYLIKESTDHGYEPHLMERSREINESMPGYTVQKVMEGMNEVERSVKGSKIALLGLAYKGGVDDMRMSPALTIRDRLEELGADVVSVDPYVEDADADHIDEVDGYDCIVICTDHDEFLDWNLPERADVIVDGRNMLDPEDVSCVYRGVGSVKYQ